MDGNDNDMGIEEVIIDGTVILGLLLYLFLGGGVAGN